MKILLSLSKTTVIPIICATSVTIQAQEQLDETVITGSSAPFEAIDLEPSGELTVFKTGTPLIDIPQSLSVFSDEQIEDQAFTSIGEIVDYTPGLNNSQGEGHRDAVVFRGVRSTADFYIDGVRDDVQYFRGLYNIEQVEILRGPSALYFGRGGTGGILNRVTKKPIFSDAPVGKNPAVDNTFRNYGISVDSFGANLWELDWNQSLGTDAAFRINTFYEYLNNHRDFYDGTRVGVNPTFALALTPDTRLDVSYEFNDHERFIDRGIPSGSNGRPVEALADTVFGDPDLNFTSFQSHVFKTTLNHRFSDNWKGRVSAFYGDYDKTYQNLFPSAFDQANNIVTIDGYVDTTVRQNLVFSGDLIGEFDTFGIGNKLLVGAEFINTSSDQDRFNAVWDTNGDDTETFSASNFRLRNGSAINSAGDRATVSFSDLNDDTRVTINSYSVYLQDEIALTNYLDLVLGARYDSFDIEVFDAANGGTLSRTDNEISPRLGVVLKPFDNLSVYGSYSETFLPRSGEQFADLGGGSDALDPDTYSNLEAGINWNLQNNLSLRMAVFQIEESSPQVSDADAGQLVVIDTETTGFEAQLTGALTDRWYLSTGYSFLDGEQVDQDGPTGLRPRELPKHTFSVWNKYQVSDRFGLGLGVVYQDNSFADNGNSTVLPSYTRVDAAAYYQLSEKTRLQLNVENLLDTDYFPNAHTSNNITVGRPINASISIKSSF